MFDLYPIAVFLRKRIYSLIKKEYFYMQDNPRYKKHSIGRFTYGSPLVMFDAPDINLKIGSFCSIAGGVAIFLGGNHRIDYTTTFPFNFVFEEFCGFKGHPASKGDVIIGNDVWIGSCAVILSGVTIGDGAVIGANSIVTKDVEPYSVVAGNPARKIKERFDKDTIERLLEIQWWEWEIEKIKENIPLMLSTGIEEFVYKHCQNYQETIV